MKTILMRWFILLAITMTLGGCFSGPNNTPSDAECRYQCTKCGKRVLMLNDTLRLQPCPEGDRHHWRYQVP